MTDVAQSRAPGGTESLVPEMDRALFHHPHFLASDARDYVRLGRHAAEEGQLEHSLHWYHKALQLWHHANERTAGRWWREQKEANREYAEVFLGRRGRLTA